MDPKIWGRNLWQSLIHIAQGYPEHPDPLTQKNFLVYFTALGYVLPCETCKTNYKSHLQDIPPDLKNSATLLNWLHQIHNRTLINMNRPEISFDSFMTKYQSTNKNFLGLNQTGLFMLILLGLVFAVIYCYGNKPGSNLAFLN